VWFKCGRRWVRAYDGPSSKGLERRGKGELMLLGREDLKKERDWDDGTPRGMLRRVDD
jgi:hypothetical protein